MNKNAIKKYAVWARRELIDRVSRKAMRYGIAPEIPADPEAGSVDGRLLSAAEKKERRALDEVTMPQFFDDDFFDDETDWSDEHADLSEASTD